MLNPYRYPSVYDLMQASNQKEISYHTNLFL